MADSTPTPNDTPEHQQSRARYTEKVLIAVGVLLATAAISGALLYIVDILLMLFGGILFALALRGSGQLLARQTRLDERWAFGVVVAVAVLLVGGLVAIAWPFIQAELQEAGPRLVTVSKNLQQTLAETPWIQELSQQFPDGDQMLVSVVQNIIPAILAHLFRTSFGFILSLGIIFFVGVWLAFDPWLYIRYFVVLFPTQQRQRMHDVFEGAGEILTRWLLGRVVAMLVVGVLTAVGLYVLDVQFPITLGTLAGLFSFVPTIGLFLSITPPLFFALQESTMLAVYVLAYYSAVQVLENYLITPKVMQRAVFIPPAFVLLLQLVLGVLVGGLGVAFAVPLAAAAGVIVQRLYIEDILGDLGDGDEAPRQHFPMIDQPDAQDRRETPPEDRAAEPAKESQGEPQQQVPG